MLFRTVAIQYVSLTAHRLGLQYFLLEEVTKNPTFDFATQDQLTAKRLGRWRIEAIKHCTC